MCFLLSEKKENSKNQLTGGGQWKIHPMSRDIKVNRYNVPMAIFLDATLSVERIGRRTGGWKMGSNRVTVRWNPEGVARRSANIVFTWPN